ncbi:putative 3-beta hydroxysteroid dehydrogenase/isomerase [Aspergillus homomorphus CBS 101889]|uniref:Flavonol reductase n=1 Tax=Aspergillus homomorphus (strain CBS 101889) TaxID=1450537 RepID=A0A395HY42_ASPHC|nr:flavonol reductase [Aspergillus homomorphus CBS 101889]RAL11778.1 flavonol reductase [Aspergillus homomorphus CBS 101889]
MACVLITGATGFIGSQVVWDVLQAGYRVRLVIRRAEQKAKLERVYASHVEQLEFAVIPDLTADGCFDEPLHGVDYALHLASPLPGAGDSDLLAPAVQGTVSILHSALKVSSIKKIVVTASVVSFIPLGGAPDGSVVRETTEVQDVEAGQVASLSPMEQYHASKIASYKATLDFVRDHHPHFDVVTLHPVFVFGHNHAQESADQLGGTCGMLYQAITTGKLFAGQFRGVHVKDVSTAHVKVLDSSIQGLQSYLLAAPPRSWADVAAFVRVRYPEVGIELEPREGTSYVLDTSKVEKELGLKFRGMEEQVSEVIDQQLGFK